MPAVPFGQFALIDWRGDNSGTVVIAPEHILLQRAPAAAIHDLSYLVVWSIARTAAVVRELEMLVGNGRRAVDTSTPELKHVLQAIEPKATAIFRQGGQCSRLFTRRQLKAALRQTPPLAYSRQQAS
jgi:hypothetical protein